MTCTQSIERLHAFTLAYLTLTVRLLCPLVFLFERKAVTSPGLELEENVNE